MKFDVYVLKLSDNKWFVSKTYDITKSYNDIMYNESCQWVKIYTPLYIHNIHYDVDESVEEEVLMEYIDRYSILNVRGGEYDDVVLSISQLNNISNIIDIFRPLST